MSVERQVRELKKKYDDEFNRVYELLAENKNLLADLEAARAKVKKAEDAGQA
jgi:ribosomal protein S17E